MLNFRKLQNIYWRLEKTLFRCFQCFLGFFSGGGGVLVANVFSGSLSRMAGSLVLVVLKYSKFSQYLSATWICFKAKFFFFFQYPHVESKAAQLFNSYLNTKKTQGECCWLDFFNCLDEVDGTAVLSVTSEYCAYCRHINFFKVFKKKVVLGAPTETTMLTIFVPQRWPMHSPMMRFQPAAVCSPLRSVRNVPMSIHQQELKGATAAQTPDLQPVLCQP